MIPRILRVGRPAVLVGGALLALAGCAADAPLDTLKPQGPISRSIDSLSDPIFLIAGIVFVLIFGASGLIWWKFRDDHSTDEFPPQVHGNFRAEIAWTIGPAVLMAAIGVFTLFGHPDVRLLDGGRNLWISDGRDTTLDVPSKQTTGYPVVERNDAPIRAFKDDVLTILGKQPLIDVRSPQEYTGERTHMPDYPEEGALRGGHIPTAISIPWAIWLPASFSGDGWR